MDIYRLQGWFCVLNVLNALTTTDIMARCNVNKKLWREVSVSLCVYVCASAYPCERHRDSV